ncbi:CPBP family intramembrane glutamic endopeptidase [Microbacterium sp. APC 3901]|uniref:CPBP family intramembrane glutamic endopeptidase n=1 Tax=Microbacterium sp. APC 3901 TaxID=3035192 RepID=UPI0025B2A9B3|nr:CPBP family intramembrane glutamic endopeptidase [Microbacterium sp. APC 3901]MDN3445527.1 CPBP family intramembrane metalloprotease [Microbacterium sp. APC 3901]
MRVTPRVWIGLAIYVGYVLVIFVVSKLSGVAYTDIGKSAEFTWRGAVLDLAVGAVLLAITTWILGWWTPALFERKRSHHKWPIFVPALMLVVAVVNLFNTDWSKFDGSFLLSLLALGLAVGFCEELMSRGLLLTALRSRLSEVWVWLFTSLLFGGMHIVNAALGAPLAPTLGQVVLAAMSGTCFYIVRRVTGSLIWAMALHGLWDVSVFSVGFAPLGTAWATFLGPVIGILAVAVVYWVIKGTDERPVAATTVAAAARH